MWLWTILSLSAYAGSGGPDIWGYSYIDSLELDGPPFGILDLLLCCLFPFLVTSSRTFRCPSLGVGTVRNTPWPMSPQTAFFFDGEVTDPQGVCPTANAWDGVAAFWDDWSSVEVRTARFGAYPQRVLVWSGLEITLSSEGMVLFNFGSWREGEYGQSW